MKVSSGGTLRTLDLNCSPAMNFGGIPGIVSASRVLQIVGNFHSLKKLDIHLRYPWVFKREAGMNVPLLDLFHRLPNLHTLSMLGYFLQEAARDPIPDCLASPHVNLKKICVEIVEFDEKEVAVISCLLQSTPSLEALEIKVPDEWDESESESEYDYEGEYEGQCLKLFKDIMYLRRASSLARIIVLDKCSK
ncbi:uncharacterized protein LOC131033589 isoform X2 [Cryptomeria japonica]|uniref:uncharacterized protein LOC131033589 isoform X2 n=1 Tax=Cryptomeria japonica TaxID=3369 RepID=UPI0025AC0052|nr:uncharacterized protein LOC131033589 isoform X2 [Cryptomeria japonica]